MKNTSVANNHDSSGAADDLNGIVVGSLGNNLIGTTGPSGQAPVAEHNLTISNHRITSASNGWDPTDLLNADPKLGALTNNGGPTQTMALLSGSPALAAGGSSINVAGVIAQLPATDQRGYSRTSGGKVD